MKFFEVIYKPNPAGRTVLRERLQYDSPEAAIAAIRNHYAAATILAVTDPAEVRNLSPKLVEALMNHLENGFLVNGEIPPSPIVAELMRQQ